MMDSQQFQVLIDLIHSVKDDVRETHRRIDETNVRIDEKTDAINKRLDDTNKRIDEKGESIKNAILAQILPELRSVKHDIEDIKKVVFEEHAPTVSEYQEKRGQFIMGWNYKWAGLVVVLSSVTSLLVSFGVAFLRVPVK